jgi:beta-1,4-mannosyltransferase
VGRTISGKLRILVTNLASSAGGNPGLKLLFDGVRSAGDVEIESYSTRAVLQQRWDIIHIYWAEWMINRGGSLPRVAADVLRVLFELRLAKKRGTKIVWTVNNIRPHESDNLAAVNFLVSAIAALADQVISPSQTVLDQFQFEYPAIVGLDQRVIPIGSYRGIYPDERHSAAGAREILGLPQGGRVALVFGMVRPYKNIPHLLRCYQEVIAERDGTFLLIAGKPLNQEIADDIQATCAGLRDVRADLRHIPDQEIQYYVRACNCLVVATSFAVTSGSAMLGLSFDRPVLMPHRGAAIEIRDNVGEEWVHTYDGGIRSKVLRRAFDIEQPTGSPPLEQHYDWTRAGHEYYAAYTRVV